MRVAVISDIHGNYIALQAVLADIAAQKADVIVCLGDTATLGPQPREVLAALKERNCIYIRGNHDAALLDPERADEYQISEFLIPDLFWCRENLSIAELKFLEAFEDSRELTFPNGVTALFFHGSPISFTDIIQSTTDASLLDKYFESQKATVFVGGHSHIQMYRRHGEKIIVNSGSVGNAFRFTFSAGNAPSLLPWAEYAILSQSDNTLNVDLRRVYFDTAELLKVVAESSLPGKAWWLKQYNSP
jgi:predicted phosphodiesterase